MLTSILPALLLTLALLIVPMMPAAGQTVSSIVFDSSQSMDGLYVDRDGTLFATGGFVGTDIYRLTLDGDLSVFATGLVGPIHLTQAPSGTYYATEFNVTSATRSYVSEISPDGTVRRFADLKAGASDIVADADGNLYVSHFGYIQTANGRSITEVAGGFVEDFSESGLLSAPVGLDFDDEGNLYAANIFDGRIVKMAPDGTQSLFASLPPLEPFTIGHLIWAGGRLYATYLGASQVWVFEPDGTGRVYAGSGETGQQDGPASEATFIQPNGIAASVTGDTLFVSEYGAPRDRLRMITPAPATDTEGTRRLPQPLRIDAAYPNPFGTATTLNFTLGTPAEVSLTVYDVLGRVVDRVEAGARAAGFHALEWHPPSLSGGTYLLRLSAGRARASRPIVYRP
ncbi:MAG: T9SS type A sorting domain-containing protein [Bacteroidota bacterium]